MSSWLQIAMIGNLGSDPDLNKDKSDNPVCNFSLAHNEKFTNRAGEAVTRTVWMKVAVWGRQAETSAQYLVKGARCLVVGTLVATPEGNPRVWTGEDGTPRAQYEMRASVVKFLGSGTGNGGGNPSPIQDADEIPF